MSRGKQKNRPSEPWRRCIVTGRSGPTENLIRFVVAPAGDVTPDLAERLPGRGVWVTADLESLRKAALRNPFARASKRSEARVSGDIVEQVERGLTRKLIESIGLAQRAGHLTAGFEKCMLRLRHGDAGARLEARDGAADGCQKLRRVQPNAPVVDCLQATELGAAIGRDHAVHLVLEPGGITKRILRDARRLSGLRPTGTSDSIPLKAGQNIEPGRCPNPRQ